MSKISIIISQEYRNRVAKKSFILLTFLMPVLMVAVITVPIWLASIDGDEEKNIAVVDQTGLYRDFFRSLESDVCSFDVMELASADRESLVKNDVMRNYRAIAIINEDLAVNPKAVELYSHKQIPREVTNFIESELSSFVEHNKLEAYNIPNLEQMVKDAHTEVKAATFKLDEDGAQSNNAEVATVVGMITTLLIYMFIFISGSQVMSAIVQEKSNRIVEVMVCSVKPWEMMWGKIIAVALVCLTQMALWAVMTFALLKVATGFMDIDLTATQQTAASIQQMPSNDMAAEIISSINSVNWTFIGIMFVVYFIGGYLLYASMFAAIGASVDNEADTNQFMMPITIIVLFALYAGIYSAENPDGPLAFWCSIIPFTSPIVMMVRIPFDVPIWEMALSLGLLALTIVATVWLSAKIYRVGILMYGKKPSFKEMIKWLKY